MSTARKIAEWDVAGTQYRLVWIDSRYTPGWEDEYAIERRTEDLLGVGRWDTVVRWQPGCTASADHDARDLLVVGIKAALAGKAA